MSKVHIALGHTATTLDPPFLMPIETVLDLPPPVSVNKTRKSHPAGVRAAAQWRATAGMHIMAAGGLRKFPKMPGRFEVTIVLDEATVGLDLDNAPKVMIDFCKRLRLIVDDSPKYMRAVHIVWGVAPEGARLILRSIEGDADYDAAKDREGCFNDAYAAVRERMAAGGKGWEPKA